MKAGDVFHLGDLHCISQEMFIYWKGVFLKRMFLFFFFFFVFFLFCVFVVGGEGGGVSGGELEVK